MDTHILIWYIEGDHSLSSEFRQIIADPNNRVSVSIASFWEIGIKLSRGKLSLSKSIQELLSEIELSSIVILPIESEHIIRVSKLLFHHKDPFDQMIISQAFVENIPMISTDSDFSKYGVTLL